jgi:hypothetical protein
VKHDSDLDGSNCDCSNGEFMVGSENRNSKNVGEGRVVKNTHIGCAEK